MPHAQRAEELALLREAAAQGSAEANYEIYELHKSWDRGDLDKAPMVPRAEADRALRKAAELGHPFSTQMLAILLDRGGTVKRDPVAARYWAERALDNPAKDSDRGSLAGFPRTPAGELGQAGGTRPRSGDTRTTQCARVLPVRRQDRTGARDPQGRPGARAEAARGGAQSRSRRRDAAAGGNADRGRRRPGRPAARAETAEGPEGHRRREGRARASLSRRQTGAARCPGSGEPDRHGRPHGTSTRGSRSLQLLAANPEVRVTHPKSTLYYATEAAELDEPGAMTALIELKLSANPQFQDRPGACKLIETAVSRGDPSMAPRLSECRAN